jgi:hypothetical protein
VIELKLGGTHSRTPRVLAVHGVRGTRGCTAVRGTRIVHTFALTGLLRPVVFYTIYGWTGVWAERVNEVKV